MERLLILTTSKRKLKVGKTKRACIAAVFLMAIVSGCEQKEEVNDLDVQALVESFGIHKTWSTVCCNEMIPVSNTDPDLDSLFYNETWFFRRPLGFSEWDFGVSCDSLWTIADSLKNMDLMSRMQYAGPRSLVGLSEPLFSRSGDLLLIRRSREPLLPLWGAMWDFTDVWDISSSPPRKLEWN